MLATAANAQHEVNLGYGYGTQHQIRQGFGAIPYKKERNNDPGTLSQQVLEQVFGESEKVPTLVNKKSSGAVFFTYRYQLFKRISIGLTAGYENEQRDVMRDGLQPIGAYSRGVYTIAGECELIYREFNHVKFFGNVGLGNTFVKEKLTGNTSTAKYTNDENYVALQLTPFGVSVGKKLRGFAQAGYGYKGIMQMGASLEL
jgi:hypothetical protein